jgi:carbon monoxide dehydrogenase subunit G
MELSGSYTFEASPDEVWQAILDPEVLARALPGTETLEKIGDNEYKGSLKIKIGAIQGVYQGSVALSDLNEPESFTVRIKGRGTPGFIDGTGQARLEQQSETTVLRYEGSAQVGGRVASVGQRLIDSSAKSLIRQSLENIHAQIKARQS